MSQTLHEKIEGEEVTFGCTFIQFSGVARPTVSWTRKAVSSSDWEDLTEGSKFKHSTIFFICKCITIKQECFYILTVSIFRITNKTGNVADHSMNKSKHI